MGFPPAPGGISVKNIVFTYTYMYMCVCHKLLDLNKQGNATNMNISVPWKVKKSCSGGTRTHDTLLRRSAGWAKSGQYREGQPD